MSNKLVAILALPLVALAWYAGLQTGRRNAPASAQAPASSVGPGTPVATFEGGAVTLEELKAQIEEQAPMMRARYTSPEGKRSFLERIVRTELLAREAQRKGYAEDPDVQRQHKRNLVAVFVQKEFEEAQQKQPVADEAIKAFYQAHLGEYVKPGRTRVAHLFFEAPATDPAARAGKRAAAEKALAEALRLEPVDYAAFGQLARELSEDAASKAEGGDLRFLTLEELTARAGAEVAEAAFALQGPGEVLRKLVETPKGFHVVKMLGRENPLDLKLEEVRDAVKSRIVFERRSESYQRFLAEIEKQAGLKIDTARLNELKIDSVPSSLPPGTLPLAPKSRVGAPAVAPPAPPAPEGAR